MLCMLACQTNLLVLTPHLAVLTPALVAAAEHHTKAQLWSSQHSCAPQPWTSLQACSLQACSLQASLPTVKCQV